MDTSTESLIYIGPTLTTRGLTRFAIFRGGLPGHVSALVRGHPCLGSLIVPVGELVRARRGLTQKGSLRHTMYLKAMAELANKEA